jgi:hypothetical protein
MLGNQARRFIADSVLAALEHDQVRFSEMVNGLHNSFNQDDLVLYLSAICRSLMSERIDNIPNDADFRAAAKYVHSKTSSWIAVEADFYEAQLRAVYGDEELGLALPWNFFVIVSLLFIAALLEDYDEPLHRLDENLDVLSRS